MLHDGVVVDGLSALDDELLLACCAGELSVHSVDHSLKRAAVQRVPMRVETRGRSSTATALSSSRFSSRLSRADSEPNESTALATHCTGAVMLAQLPPRAVLPHSCGGGCGPALRRSPPPHPKPPIAPPLLTGRLFSLDALAAQFATQSSSSAVTSNRRTFRGFGGGPAAALGKRLCVAQHGLISLLQIEEFDPYENTGSSVRSDSPLRAVE